MKKYIIVLIIVAVLLVGGVLFFYPKKYTSSIVDPTSQRYQNKCIGFESYESGLPGSPVDVVCYGYHFKKWLIID